MVKNPSANEGDSGSISGLGRSPGVGNSNHSSILAWKIPQTEEPGGLQYMGLQRVRQDLETKQQDGVSFWYDENILKVGGGHGCTTSLIYKMSLNSAF